jgi:hypothetical protein
MNGDPSPLLQHLEINQLKAVIGKAKIAFGERPPHGAYEDLYQFVSELTFPQRVELVSLVQVGRGVERFTIKNWSRILRQQSANAEFPNYITTMEPLAEYLEKAADILELKEEGF